MSFFTMCVLAAGIGMALGTLGTGIGQGLAVKSAVEGVSRNPGASGKILTTMMIGLAMIESLAIYAPVSYTHLRAHETRHDLVCRLLLEKKKKPQILNIKCR